MDHKLAEPKGCNTVGITSFVFGLVGGTGCSIVIKVLYQLEAVDINGQISNFEKPLFLTWIMFMAMALALPIYFLHQFLFNKPENRTTVPWRVLWWLVIPTLFDLAGTNLAQIGLVYTTVSYFQLLRCTVIVVTAMLKAFVLKQRLATYMWVGVTINIVAMVLVSITNFLQPEEVQPTGPSDPLLGVIFILLSCVVQGSQYIFEEKVMAVDDAPPLIVIGMEGLWGTIIMLVLFPVVYFIPGRDKGSVEDIFDSFVMVQNSTAIQTMLWVFFVTITLYNLCGIYVTASLSAIWHAILDNFRPVSVWTTDLIIYYFITNGRLGEAWTTESWIQFAGMMVLFAGTAVYNGTLRVPGIDYEHQYEPLAGSRTPGMAAPPELASSALMSSPLLRRASLGFESPGLQASINHAKQSGVHPPVASRRLRAGSEERGPYRRGSDGIEYGFDGSAR